METTTQHKTHTVINENSQTIAELHKAGATVVVGFTSLMIGSWAVACMTAGVIACGGPVPLATEYIKALVG